MIAAVPNCKLKHGHASSAENSRDTAPVLAFYLSNNLKIAKWRSIHSNEFGGQNSPDPAEVRLSRRAGIVLLAADGFDNHDIGEMLGVGWVQLQKATTGNNRQDLVLLVAFMNSTSVIRR